MLDNEDYFTYTGDTGDFQVFHNEERFKELAELFPIINSILVPKKAEHNLRKYVSKALLKEINSNIDIAVEKCLLLLSNLASTHYVEDSHLEENRWKRLHSKILDNQIGGDNIYKKIIDVLKLGTSTGAMLEVVEDDIPNVQCRRYCIPESYYRTGLKEYLIKDIGIVQRRNKSYFEQLNNAMANPICNNLVKIYPKLELPTPTELLAIGKQWVKKGILTKKGKIPTLRNKHLNSYWKDYGNRSFVEDNIKIFEYLTNRGFMIPSVCNERSGGRIVDSFTLMPSWIRGEITIDGKKLVECDYTALHPNLAMKEYEGTESFLTHPNVGERAKIHKNIVKIEHLSFFNKTWNDMRLSPLFNFYSIHQPNMLQRIYLDKKENGHKITSMKLFKMEVDIMTDVIQYLNSKGVYVLYVYDALLCEEKDQAFVTETMNRIVLEHGVFTRVKTDDLSNPIPQNIAFTQDADTVEYEAEYLPIQAEPNNSQRLTITEFFKRCKIKYGSFVSENEFDSINTVLSNHFIYFDEVDEETKEMCKVSYLNNDGNYQKRPLFTLTVE